MRIPSDSPARHGAWLALLAAALFGVSTPLVQRAGQGVGPFSTAALLYAGAALLGAFQRRAGSREAALRGRDWPRLGAMAACGAVVGPVALAWGLQRTSAASASMMLALEAVFTAAFAWALYREVIDRRIAGAMTLMLAGGLLLIADQGLQGEAQGRGLLAVLVATIAWGADNTLSRGVADRDPARVVLAKAGLGAVLALLLALGAGEPLPAWTRAATLLAIGATGYGLSLRLYLLAQRHIGAARTGSVFATAPFVGAVAALALGDRGVGIATLTGGALMAAGVWLHLTEAHRHEHAHEPLEHEHAHRHDDGHHDHEHATPPRGAHSHSHRHDARVHAHPHVPDAHHGHRH